MTYLRGHTQSGVPFTDAVAFTSALTHVVLLAQERKAGLATTAGTTPERDFRLLLAKTRRDWRPYLAAAWDEVVNA